MQMQPNQQCTTRFVQSVFICSDDCSVSVVAVSSHLLVVIYKTNHMLCQQLPE